MDTWSEGFLTQAKQDYATIQAVIARREQNIQSLRQNKKLSSNEKAEEPLGATLCMLFQMFFEKYSKACLCRWNGDTPPRNNHKTVKDFIARIKRSRNKELYPSQGCKLMQELENLQPANVNDSKPKNTRPQLEYPWQDTTAKSSAKVIRTPATDLDIALRIDDNSSNELNHLNKIATMLLNDFDKITSPLI